MESEFFSFRAEDDHVLMEGRIFKSVWAEPSILMSLKPTFLIS